MKPPSSTHRRPGPVPAGPMAVAALGILAFSTMDGVMKVLALGIGVYNTMLWRGVINVGFTGAAYFLNKPPNPSRAAWRLHFWRTIAVLIASFAFFFAVTRLALAVAIGLTFIAPLIALFLAAVILGEHVGWKAISGSLLGLAGVMVMLAEQVHAEGAQGAFAGVAAAIVSAIAYAVNLILLRKQAQTAGPREIAFIVSLIGLGLMLFAAPWLAVWPEPGWWTWLLAASLLSIAGMALFAWAYGRAEARFLVPFEYSSFLWAALIGWMWFGERLSPPTLIGATLIATGCLIATRQKIAPAPGEPLGS